MECDPTLIRIALSNLLDNAVKYSGGGAVELSGSADDGHVKFAVGDEGPGLNGVDIERLFQRFARGTAKKVSGAGLGLYVARSIARLHGGDVSAHNKPGGGAVFELEIRRRLSAVNPT
ncbi:MAG: ATP-binding protein [Nitrospirae bacterium]|nr:MAG: ATP-binding protein [Nitrospirota bacterium]